MKVPFTLKAICLIVMTAFSVSVYSQSNAWSRMQQPGKDFTVKADRWASEYAPVKLSVEKMKHFLSQAPSENNVKTKNSTYILDLPMPDGSYSAFKIVESPVMEPGLALAYPGIKTYAGRGIDDPTASVRFDLTQFGFHAMILSASGTVYIDPVDRYNTSEYISYYRKHALRQDPGQECLINDEEHHHDELEAQNKNPKQDIQGELRIYRLALACTGEYAAYHGGTVAGALAGMVTTMNRVNGVYEREFGIHMNLIENDTLLIYTNANTDPYSNFNGSTMLTQNQNNITSIIGTSNFDIGHVFSTGGGGIAMRASVCKATQKAQGVTGLDTPIGDAFDIDYVAHEMGHQYGGNHTFNCTAGACGGGTRVASAAFEPGSGSTIMAYAGICTGQDLQAHSDDYFHTKSYDEIVTYTHNNTGNTCPVINMDSNQAPVLVIPPDYNIPLLTPFKLTATATDPDGDALTFCWEEFDLGPAGNWNNPSGDAPIFRSFNPTTSGTRIFPKLSNILSNTNTIGEIKPSYARTLDFRCTVRDNVLEGAGVTYNPNTVQVNVIATPGPFAVLTPNTVGVVWAITDTQTVSWSVNNTDQAPINCATVNVMLSTDGGQTFQVTLGAGVPNTGSYSFVVPNNPTNTARVMVESVGNIFFDINDKNFVINNSVGIAQNNLSTAVSIVPNPAHDKLDVIIDHKDKGLFTLALCDITGKIIKEINSEKNSLVMNTSFDLSNLSNGLYFIRVSSEKGSVVKKVVRN
ncbi:MAG: reprolysin-like metallopeptidase [Bacteroidales bacterium]